MESCTKGTGKNHRTYPFHLISDYVYLYNGITEDTPYEIEEMDAEQLILPERLDLAIKYYFIQCREEKGNITYATELYKQHIDAFSDGMYLEPGNKEKDTFQKYMDSFCELIEEFKTNGYQSAISLIPVGKDNVLLDGAHRVACAAYFRQKVKVIRFPHLSVCYDYQFFRKRLLEEEYLAFAVRKYCELKSNCFIAFIWPKAYKDRKLVIRKLQERGSKFLYSRKMKLTYEQFWNLIYHIYQEEKWIGNVKNNFRGVGLKASQCFEHMGMMELLVFEGSIDVRQLKEDIRKEIGSGKSSLHMTDHNKETVEALSLIMELENKKIDRESKQKKYYSKRLIRKKVRNLYTSTVIFVKKILRIPV